MTATPTVKYEVVTFEDLTPVTFEAAHRYYSLSRVGARYRQLRINLNAGAFQLQKGLMQYIDGPVTLSVEGGGLGGMLTRAITQRGTGDGGYKTTYQGTGAVYTEPSLQHYMIRFWQVKLR